MQSSYKIWTPGEEKLFFKNAIVVFDSSAVLNFYEYSEIARQNIFNNIFQVLKDRLWITNWTEYEFAKNRDRVILQPNQTYKDIKDKHFPSLHFRTFLKQFEELKNRTKRNEKHPYFSAGTFLALESSFEEISNEIRQLEKRLDEEINERVSENNRLLGNDVVRQKIFDLFSISDGYTYQKLIEIVKDGEFRYRNKIPPGYKDKKDKVGFSIYGDLIIWNQIQDIAKKYQKPIILVIDDLKEDWCYQEKNSINVISPREELIKELKDKCGVMFWSYSSSQFLYKANEFLGSEINDDVLQEVKEISNSNPDIHYQEAVFEWAKLFWKEYDVNRISNYWKRIIGIDLVVETDDSRLGIIIQHIDESIRVKDFKEILRNLNNLADTMHGFNQLSVVFVCDNQEFARAFKTNGSISPANLRILSNFFGYLGEGKEFNCIN